MEYAFKVKSNETTYIQQIYPRTTYTCEDFDSALKVHTPEQAIQFRNFINELNPNKQVIIEQREVIISLFEE